MYFHKTPGLLKKFYPNYIWDGPELSEPTIYLTFDDGPHPTITPWVLEQLEAFNASATFFCIGKNVEANPEVFQKIKALGNEVGNHTHNHLKGSAVETPKYLADVNEAAQFIDSKLFRPPYGRLKRAQAKALLGMNYKIIMWGNIPGDWDHDLSPQDCLEQLLFNLEPGQLVVLHDSEKAYERMSYLLPRLLEHCRKQQWNVRAFV